MYEHLPPTPYGKEVLFESSGVPPGPEFRTGYFGMPLVLRPFETSDEEMELIRGKERLTFAKDGRGFRLTSIHPLPSPPPDPVLQKLEEAPPSEV